MYRPIKSEEPEGVTPIGGINVRSSAWKEALLRKHPGLFGRDGHSAGYPEVGDGWSDLVERACARLAAAISAGGGQVTISQIKQKYATIRIYVDTRHLDQAAQAAVDEAITLAEARSACTCETCGEPGRLFERSDWLETACDLHGRGRLVEERPGWENIRITRRLVGGRLRIVSCRRYVRETDSFVDVPPFALGIKEG